jgi:hypothetical protein
MDFEEKIELAGLAKNINYSFKYLEDVNFYRVGDVCRGGWVIKLSKPFQVDELCDFRAEGGKINTPCKVWKHWVYVN